MPKTTTINYSLTLVCHEDLEMSEDEIRDLVERTMNKSKNELIIDERLSPDDFEYYVSIDQRY